MIMNDAVISLQCGLDYIENMSTKQENWHNTMNYIQTSFIKTGFATIMLKNKRYSLKLV